MAQSHSNSRLTVLMFTDLVGSTALKDALRTRGYLPLLQRHDELLRNAVGSAAGSNVQQDTGDGVFATFATASDAVRAALRFQWLMRSEPWPADAKLESRVGIHLGEVAETSVQQDGGNKLVGLPVDLSARVMSLAEGGQILLTREAFNSAREFVDTQLDGMPAVRWVAHGPYLFKGNSEPMEVFEVGLQGIAPLTPPAGSEKATRYVRPGDEETLGWRPAVGQTPPSAPQWIVSEKLGEGGFGEVWLATHAKAKSRRVFKFCFDADRLRGLKREVALIRLLKEALGDRRDIAAVRDWQFEQAPYFIELEYTPAGNLVNWCNAQGGVAAVPLAQRVGIVAGVARALAQAHSVGVLHKDIKPSNVLMVQDDEGDWYPRVTDFGIGILMDRSKLADHKITAAGFTESTLIHNDSSRTGTRMYAPPESLAGKPHTVQGDIYALGVLLYQLVIGNLEQPLATGWERDVPDELLRADIATCVDTDPARRFSSANELAERLETLGARRQRIAEEAEAVRAAEEAKRRERLRELESQRAAARRRRLARVGAGVVVALTLIVIGSIVLLQRERTLRGKAQTAENAARDQETIARAKATEAVVVQSLLVRAMESLDAYGASGQDVMLERSLDDIVGIVAGISNEYRVAKASVLGVVGRAYNHRPMRGADAIRCLEQARDLLDTPIDAHTQLRARTLNSLAWAYAHANRPADGIEPARVAADIYKELFGEQSADAVAALSDYGRMRALAGQGGVVETALLIPMLYYEKQFPTPQNIERKRAELAVLAAAIDADWVSGKRDAAKAKVRDYVKPFVANGDRIRQRMPWILSQFGQYLYDSKGLPAAGVAVATVGAELATEILGAGHEDLKKTADLLQVLQKQYEAAHR